MNPNSENTFTAVPNRLLGILNGFEIAVFTALRYHGIESFPSHKRIAQLAGVSVPTVKRTLNSLKDKGILSWTERIMENRQLSNLYVLHVSEADWTYKAGCDQPAISEPPGQPELPVALTDLPPRSHRATELDQEELEESIKEESPPASPPRPSGTDRKRQRLLTIYMEHKPEAWPGKKLITDPTMRMASHWINQFGCEEEFFIALEKALKYAQKDPWWSAQNLTLETLLRTTKTTLVNLSEKYDTPKPNLSRGTGYTGTAPRPGPPITKMTLELINKQREEEIAG